jgi:hypothetical protein
MAARRAWPSEVSEGCISAAADPLLIDRPGEPGTGSGRPLVRLPDQDTIRETEMADEQETLDTLSIKQIGDAAERLRTTARWTVGAVAALGTTVGGAITFAGLADLHGARLTLGAIGLALVAIAAAVVVVFVARVLAPTSIPLPLAGEHVTAGALDDMLLGAPDLPTFAQRLESSEQALADKLIDPPPPSSPPVARPSQDEVDRARARATIYGARAERIRLIAHFSELQARWRKALRVILGAVAVIALGVVLNQLATSRQRVADKAHERAVTLADRKTERTQKVADLKLVRRQTLADHARTRRDKLADAPQLPEVAKAPEFLVTLAPGAGGMAIADHCLRGRRAVKVPGQHEGQTAFLLRPYPTCAGRFVRVADGEIESARRLPVVRGRR